MQTDPITNTNQEESDFNLKHQIAVYLKHWKWFVLSVIVTMTIAFLYLRYSIPMYKASTTVLVKDDKRGGLDSQADLFADLGMGGLVKKNVDNEIEVVKSRSLIRATVQELGLNVVYRNKGNIRTSELYKNAPIEILFSNVSPDFYDELHSFKTQMVSDSTKFIFYEEDIKKGVFSFGQTINYKGGNIVVFKKHSDLLKGFKESPVFVDVIPLSKVTASYKKGLTVNALNKTSSVIELSIIDPIPARAEDFLATLIKNYNRDAISDKKFMSESTCKFIDGRIELISKELGDVEKDKEAFKRSNRVTDITSEAGLYLANASEFEKKAIEIETQLKVVESMVDYVDKMKDTDLVPMNILGAGDQTVEAINQYNQFVLDRNRIIKNAGPDNIAVLNLNKRLVSLREEVKSSLERQKVTLEITLKDLERQNAVMAGKISRIPTLERESLVLGRQQKIKEELYIYLLEKREESAIMASVAEPSGKVIDEAMVDGPAVSPKRSIIYLAAFLLGLLIPFAIIYVLQLLDNKVKNHFDIVGKLNIPFLGDLPISESPNEIMKSTSGSSTAEALRIIRTNLEFMLSKVQEDVAKTIFVTSTLPNEGKTFISVNMAGSLALTGKKVLLIGMDIRNPKFGDYLNLNKEGLTNYLMSSKADINDYITKQEGFDAFYVLAAGVIPPNPTELLMGDKIGEMFAELKKEYDYIVVDTTPTSLVADTMVVAKYADTFVYVVRANMLDKSFLQIPQRLHAENKLPNMSMLLNGSTSIGGYGYYGYGYGYGGYGYGYGVEVKKDPWYKNLMKW